MPASEHLELEVDAEDIEDDLEVVGAIVLCSNSRRRLKLELRLKSNLCLIKNGGGGVQINLEGHKYIYSTMRNNFHLALELPCQPPIIGRTHPWQDPYLARAPVMRRPLLRTMTVESVTALNSAAKLY